MKVAISASEPGMSASVDPRFGRAHCFVVIDLESGALATSDNTISQSAAHGAGIQAAKTVVEAGARTVITGNVGPKALAALQAAHVDVYQCSDGTVQQAVERWWKGSLTKVTAATV